MPINYKELFFMKPYFPKEAKEFYENYNAENMPDEQKFDMDGIRRMLNANKLQADLCHSEKE